MEAPRTTLTKVTVLRQARWVHFGEVEKGGQLPFKSGTL
jgi:hypothetical protein